MRDPKRIYGICRRLAQAWKCFPDMRLMQIISAVEQMYKAENRVMFYAEDDEAIEKIELLLTSMGSYV